MSESTAESGPATESVRREEDREARERGEFVGFVGCPKVGVLKVRVASERRTMMRVLCPSCKEVHSTGQPMARAMRAGELVTLIEEGRPMAVGDDPTPPDPTELHGSQTITDAAIYDAIPPGRDAEACAVGEALGYAVSGGTPTGLLARLRRMNARAVKAGDPAPFVITPGHGGGRPAPTLIRRAEP